MQKKNLFRVLALALTLVMALALCAPALAKEEAVMTEEELAELEAALVELEAALAELEAELAAPAEYLWTKFRDVPLYRTKNNTLDPFILLNADTVLKVVEYGETWTKVELCRWFNDLDGQGNQVQIVELYVLTKHLTDKVPYVSFSYYHPYWPIVH